MPDLLERYQGCLLGLAVGDAVGTTLEFKPRGSFSPISDMVGGGPFDLKAGQWTDDTSMALCLAQSLIYKKGFDAEDQMNRYCNWRDFGYLSSTGDCFDIGNTISSALNQYLITKEPYAGSNDEKSSGNGSLMRLAPVAMFYNSDLEQVIKYSGESSRTTHGSSECIDACRYFASLLHVALSGKTKKEILACDKYAPETVNVNAIAAGLYQTKTIDQIKGTGYVINSLEAALWCFANTDRFDDAILAAANLGDDADTTAAICGQLAGAFYGIEGIPGHWQKIVYMGEEIKQIAAALLFKK